MATIWEELGWERVAARPGTWVHKKTKAVNKRFDHGMRSALCSWLLTSGPTLFCNCKIFSCKACQEKCFPASAKNFAHFLSNNLTFSLSSFFGSENRETLSFRHVKSKTRTYYGRFGSARRTAEWRGAVGRGRTACRQVGWPVRKSSL